MSVTEKQFIRNGIRKLNCNMPDWRERINLDRLDMNCCYHCLLGQLYGNYYEGKYQLEIGFGSYSGFDASKTCSFQRLGKVWARYVRFTRKNNKV